MTSDRRYATLDVLPDLSGRRFTTAQLGPDRVTQIREEFSELRALAARVLGVDEPHAVTRELVQAFLAQGRPP